MDITPTAASLLVGSVSIFGLTIRGMLAANFDRTTIGAPDGYTRGDKRGFFAACAAVIVVAPFSYWVAPKLAAIQADNDVIPDAGWSVIGYCLVAVSALNAVRGLYVKYMEEDTSPYRDVNDGVKTARSIVHTTVGALGGSLAAAMFVS